MSIFHLERETLENTKFRRILYTSPSKKSQVVLMKLDKDQEIGLEKHSGDQFIRIEKGKALAIIQEEYIMYLEDGDAIVIPENTLHNIIALSTLHLYTIYSPAQH